MADPISPISYKQRNGTDPRASGGGGAAYAGGGDAAERWRQNYVATPYEPYQYPSGAASHHSHRGAQTNQKSDKATEEGEERGHWGSKAEFLLSCIGLSVGIGNVWRFPYLAFENGGAVFLIPYIILLVLIGKPMYLMETAIGQYSQLGPLNVWRCAPVMYGVGVAMVVLSLLTAIYYNQLMAYSLFYLFASMAPEVPWAKCDPSWADESCFDVGLVTCSVLNITNPGPNDTCTTKTESSASQYWTNYVLEIEKEGLRGPGDIGTLKWDLSLCLLLSWLTVFLCLMKGVKSSGKVVYFTATFPYIILIALLIMGVQIEGATKGLTYLFIPKWEEILNVHVWRQAATQMFYSLSVSWGGLIMFGSYNKFRNKVHIDAFLVSSLDFITSLIASVAIFSVLGAMAHDLGVEIKDVAKDGPGLAFVAYPEAISRTLPVPQLWAVLFFFMLFTLGLDSEFAFLETFTTALYDTFPKTRSYKVTVTAATCLSCFLLGLPLCSTMGQYIFKLMDNFGGGIGVLLIAIFELIAVHWIYGVRRFTDDIYFMLGFRPSMFWNVCWVFIAPVSLTVIFVYSSVTWENPVYNGIPYPPWAINLGWFLAAISVIFIPIFFIIRFFQYIITGKIAELFKPSELWGPGDAQARQELLAGQSNFKMEERIYGIDNPAMDPRYK
ncbi:sodium-dependent proline transporter-like isoform X2 [Oratosquilla oratoria]|uniref:sodium-dependent proline transporter-like isoform X2 n=1 Tax=Oratosquilla oratoria TaxID=337810 RepID=UPI003F76A268